MRSRWWVGACFAGACIAACGEDDRVDESKERITQAAYNKACSEARDFLESRYSGDYFVQALCTASAVENSGDALSCGEMLDTCINTPPPAIQTGIDNILSQAGCSLLDLDPNSCSSTLGEIKACLDAIDAEVASIKYTLTCAAAGQTLDGWDIVDLPAACNFPSECSE